MMATDPRASSDSSDDPSVSLDSTLDSIAAPPPLAFRPHHPHLKPQTLQHTSSFSSISSYSSDDDDDGNANDDSGVDGAAVPAVACETEADRFRFSSPADVNARAQSHRVPTKKQKRRQRPGDGTIMRPAGRAHDWYSGGRITSFGRWFRDSQNRTLLLRGVNLCGNSKLPTTPNGSSHLSEGFFNHRDVCFLGRPFQRDQAHEHFSRLQQWGLTFVRLLVPWEALEHSGPGIYDEKFIDSLIDLIKLMPRYGIKCFIDPHQDCWSRFSGGSGAPGWTFEAAGLDITKFKATGAAYVHNTNQYPGDNPPMVWPTNYTKLAASTMFTLFWAGDTFAPNKFYCGESIQQFLQNKYIACYQHLAKRLSHLDAIIGYEVMNEPHPGYLGLKNLKRYDFNSNLFFGDFPSALESMALGDGMALPIEVWVKSWPYPTRKEKTRLINAHKESAWLEGECLWKQHGVWSINPRTGLPQVDRPNYFTTNPINGEKVNFTKFYLDFVNRYSVAIQKVVPSAFIFVEPVPNEAAPVWRAGDHEDNVVYAPHWYDLHSVFNKSFDGRITHDVQGLSKGKNVISATFFGIKGAKKNYRGQISNVLNLGLKNVGPKPCLIGECGIPMDINQRQAFMSGDYGYQSKFLDAVLSAMESNLLSFTLWNYNTTNDNTYGDHWNGEDFSIFSLDSPLSTQGLNSTEALVESRVPLREQAPNFARELAKRASVQHGGLDLTVMAAEDESSSSGSGNEEDMDTLPGQGRHSENSDDEDHTNLEDDDSPFDRSYFCFDHEGSIGGRDHKAHIGGRALDAVIRPYAAKVAGEPVSSEFDIDTLQFTFRFRNYVQTPVPVVHITAPEQLDQDICSTSPTISDSNASNLSGSTCVDPSVTSPSSEPATARFAEGTLDPALFGHPPEGTTLAFETEFFIPSYHYGGGMLEILVSDGDWRFVKERQTLYYRHRDMGPGAIHSVRIMPRREPTPLVVDGESVKAMEVRIPGSWDTRPYDGHQEAKRGETQRECIIM